MQRPIRVLIAKVGLDGHDRGAKVIASFLRDAGMEVVYTGLRQTPEKVVNAALQEDVDAIGISILSGAHMTVFPRIIKLMKEKGMDDVLLTGGGIIPDRDMKKLHDEGVGDLFAPGTDTKKIVDYYMQGFDIEPRVWFSGNRGFHIEVAGEAYGAKPDSNLTYYFHHVVREIVQKLELTTVDESIYSIPRLWRINNTIHHKTGLYKRRIRLQELNNMKNIIKFAESKYDIDDDNDELPVLNKQYLTGVKLYKANKTIVKEAIDQPYDFTGDPPCIRFLLEHGLAELGTKNKADMCLSGYYKDSGKTLEEALDLLDAWSRSIALADTHIASPEQRVLQTMRVAKTVYSNQQYRFSCGSIKQCGDICKEDECNVQKEGLQVELENYAKAKHMGDRKSTRLNSSHIPLSRMPSSA